ncbi:MAG: hypothetical protein ACRYFU_25045 [Janthinobacterium lividum]
MTRLELLQLVVARARTNGFEFRRWYTGRLSLPWISAEASLTLLDTQRRYYALLFSHEFASTFWKPGTDISFEVPAQSFARPMPDGSIRTIQRKSYIRRSLRPDVWRYHLREMSVAEEPLRYLRKYLHIEEQLDADPLDADPELLAAGKPDHPGLPEKKPARTKPIARPLPSEKPAFLKRPYVGSTG